MAAESIRLFRLFIASYSPLAVILAIQRSSIFWPLQEAAAFWGFACIGLFGLVDAYRLPRGALRKGHIGVTLSQITDEGGQVAAYIATYLLPFVGFEVTEWREGAALLIYFSVLFVVFIRSDLALINPALYLAGWRVVSARRGDRRVLMLVPRDVELIAGDLSVVAFGRFLVYDP